MAVIVRLPVPPEGSQAKRKPGRPRKVVPAVISEDDYLVEIDAARQKHVAQDALVTAGDRDALGVLDEVITKIAEEAAGLALDAARVERRGGDACRVRSRRLKALLQLAGLVRDRELLHRERGCLSPEVIATVKEMFLEEVTAAAHETLGSDAGAGFVALLKARMTSVGTG